MKDVLQYTEEELRSLSDEELHSLLEESEAKESLWNTKQLVEKTLINSLYGSMGNRHFPLFNEDMAAAITGNGRFFIQKMARYIEAKLQAMLPQEKPYIVYGDTDSVYFHIEPFVNMYMDKNPGLPINDYVDWADSFEQKVIQPVIQQTITDFAYQLNAYNKDKIGAEREIIADCVAPNSTIKVKQNNKLEVLSISKFFNKFSESHPQTKEQEVVDISDLDYQILSYNEDTGEKELKRIVNVQKKVTSKQLLDVISPTGKIITVTEDHKFAINVNGSIIWKEARYIDENDDVIFYDNTFYNKENCELYGIEYVNHGSKNCDLHEKGKRISEAKAKRYETRKDKNTKDIIKRLNHLYNKNGNHLKTFLRIMRFNKTYTRSEMLNFFKTVFIFDESFLNMLEEFYFKSDETIKELKIRKKYGNLFYKKLYLLNTEKKRRIAYRNFENRCQLHLMKYKRRYKQTELQRQKDSYRREVVRYTKRSVKENHIENIELVDKYNYNLDHIVPIMYGFHNKIPPELIGHIDNLMVIPKIENIKKRCNINFDYVNMELFGEYL